MTYVIEKNLTEINKGAKGDNTPEWIIFHFVGASGQALDNAKFFKSVYRGASAHYFIDPDTLVQVVEDDTPSWSIGDGASSGKGEFNGYVHPGGATNTNSISIEACQDITTGEDVWHWQFHPETLKKAEWLIREKQLEHNIDDAHVIRHYDASGKICPGNWQYDDWKKWWEFKDRLEQDIVQPAPSAEPKDAGKHADEHMHLVEAGETLYGIAKTHGVTVDQLVQWNDLHNKDLIFPETKLFVKAPEVPDSPDNDIEQMAKDVINGKYGNGEQRRNGLGEHFDEVQKLVNDILLGRVKPKVIVQDKADTSGNDIDRLADEVLRGKHGSGRERMISLGVNYAKVQAEVNRRMRS